MFQAQTIRHGLLASALCVAFALTASFAHAGAVIDVGVGGSNASGAGVIGAAGDQWNKLGTGSTTASNLITTTGTTTGVSISVTADGGGGAPNTSPNTSITNTYDWTVSNSPITVSLSGLAPNNPYDLYVYGVSDSSNGAPARPGIVAAAAANGGGTAPITGNTTLSSWVSGQNYVELVVHSDSLGNLSFTDTRVNSETDLNGFQLLNATPEPGSMLLMGLGTVGLLVTARRLRAAKKGKRGSSRVAT